MVLFALSVVYLVWGLTYLVVKIALQSWPPFLLIGIRLILAGALLYVWERFRCEETPRWRDWFDSARIGALLLVSGLGAVIWSVQWLPSGLAALLVSTMPIFLALLELKSRAKAPSLSLVLGLLTGLGGLALLLGSLGRVSSSAPTSWVGVLVVLMAAFSWALGSHLSSKAELQISPGLFSSMQMISSGLILSNIGLWKEERVYFLELSSQAIMAFLFLTFLGSLLAYSAYLWLLRNTSPTLTGTYAYVNPVLAIFFGWYWLGEELTLETLSSCAVVLLGVALILWSQRNSGNTEALAELS